MVDLVRQDDSRLLPEFVRCRSRGDARGAAGAWEQLAVNNYDRVAGLVRLFRYPGGSGIVADDVEDAVQEAFLRVNAMAANFRGSSLGEFRAALRTAVSNACMDFGRPVLRHATHAGGSLDEPATEDEVGGSRYDAVIGRLSVASAARSEEVEEAESLVRWGIAQIDNDGYREALELTYLDQLSGEEIAERLQITEANVYQRRRRGLQKLEKILRDDRD
jgi:RNA polymerase sigma factor (sigma-70 family)